MVCIAAFIILLLIGFFVLILSIWFPNIGKRYLKVFKKAWGCVGKRLTLQKCETSFKDDIKNSVLKKVVIKKPKLVKPLSLGIEVLAVIIVFITIFSLVEAAKGGLALYAFGTCNVSNPNACIVGNTNVCPTGESARLNWFEEWGVIFQGIPERRKTWDANDYINENAIFYREFDSDKKTVLNIFDPLCHGCMLSFNNQLDSGFFDRYNVAIIPFSLRGETKDHRYNNSYLIGKFILAIHEVPLDTEISPAWQVVAKLFTEEYKASISWQTAFANEEISAVYVYEVIEGWLREIGYDEEQVLQIVKLTFSEEIQNQMALNEKLVTDEINIRGVPTTIYNGRRHTGVFRT